LTGSVPLILIVAIASRNFSHRADDGAPSGICRLTPLAIVAVAAMQAEADAKAPQLAVFYRKKPHGNKSCHTCVSYIANKHNRSANGSCKRVAGSISPKGYCVLWHAGDNSNNV